MPMKLNKTTYAKLIQEDIEWLESCTKNTLERKHIIDVLNDSINQHYPAQPIIEADAKDMRHCTYTEAQCSGVNVGCLNCEYFRTA